MAEKYQYFGKYVLLEKLAAGGMAEVFLARAPGAGGIAKNVAIKRILPKYSDNNEFIEMFKNEAKIAVNLSHSNIVSIYEFGVEDGQFFLVMDFVRGRNIRQILQKMSKQKMRLSVDQIVYICKEIAAGLDHAHRCVDGSTGKSLNIIHRDMSPQNVLVSFEGEIKIIDFGIAKAETQVEETRAGTLKGKFGYMSPEQVEGHPVDLRTDIFSLGIVMWELLANERLFIANNEINTLRKIKECNVPDLTRLNPDVHPELERIVQKALTKDKANRYQTGSSLQRDLSKFLNRHFPDFSSQDFSIVIKSLYTDEILELSDRMKVYAKAPFREEVRQHRSPETVVAGTQTREGLQQNQMDDQDSEFVDYNGEQLYGNVQNSIKLLHRNEKTPYKKKRRAGIESTIQTEPGEEVGTFKQAAGQSFVQEKTGTLSSRTRTNVAHDFRPYRLTSKIKSKKKSDDLHSEILSFVLIASGLALASYLLITLFFK